MRGKEVSSLEEEFVAYTGQNIVWVWQVVWMHCGLLFDSLTLAKAMKSLSSVISILLL